MRLEQLPEPWLRGTLTEVAPAARAVLHALQLAQEDIDRWCGDLTDEQLNARPAGLAPMAFHLRHIARSLDRLLTYAEGKKLSAAQLAALSTELDAGASSTELVSEFTRAIDRSAERIRGFDPAQMDEPRSVGRLNLPTTVCGLLIHIAEHTQRHVGQAITTAKIAAAQLV
jgi:uncharacterized damage-inducible protein DinB